VFNVVLSNTGVLNVLAGGTSIATVVNSGGMENLAGIDAGATISSGGQQIILAGGTADNAIVNDPGFQEVTSGGAATGTTLNDGIQKVDAGGTASGTIIYAGGDELVYGSDSGSTVNAGGTHDVESGGTAASTTISGGTEYVHSGGTAGTVSFSGTGGLLKLDQPAGLTGAISNFAIGDTIDFVNTAITSAVISSTALTITEANNQTQSYQLANLQSGALVQLESDNNNGTDLILTPQSSWNSAVNGSWNTASAWSPAAVPGAANQANIAVSGTYTVTSSQNNATGSLNITDAKATLAITNKSTFTLGASQASSNSGTISIAPGSILDNTGTLSNSNLIESVNIGSTTLENGIVNNSGAVEATGLTTLVLNGVTIDNLFPASKPGGVIKTTLGSAIEFDNASIMGGVLGGPSSNLLSSLLAGQGTLVETMSGSQANVLDGSVSPVTNEALLLIKDNSALTLKGTITNSGAISLNPASNPTNLLISGNVTLNGGGEIILAGKQAGIAGTGSGASLTNVNDTILGAGSIGTSLSVSVRKHVDSIESVVIPWR
jgi:autotransporter passenger strand-loop-strand repeat protein